MQFVGFLSVCYGYVEIAQPSIVQIVNPSVHGDLALLRPGSANNRGLGHGNGLFHYVQFAQAVPAGFCGRKLIEDILVSAANAPLACGWRLLPIPNR